eukprot:163284-Amphidinium_carterae.1
MARKSSFLHSRMRNRFLQLTVKRKHVQTELVANNLASSFKELQAPLLDDEDEAWLSDVRTFETDAKGGTLKWKLWVRMFYLATAKHTEKFDQDVACYAASGLKWHSRARLRWRKMKTGRKRARRVGSGGARSSLPSVAEEEACDAFLERIRVDQPD